MSNEVKMTLTARAEEFARQRKLKCVPEEYAAKFAAVDISDGATLFGASIELIAACNKCGALVYPTALDRHVKFHEERNESQVPTPTT